MAGVGGEGGEESDEVGAQSTGSEDLPLCHRYGFYPTHPAFPLCPLTHPLSFASPHAAQHALPVCMHRPFG